MGRRGTGKTWPMLLATGALLGSMLPAVPALATSNTATVVGDLYYTRYCGGGPNVKKVSFSFDGTTWTMQPPASITTTNGADGIIFAPDGDLLVGGQGNTVHKVNPVTAAQTSVFTPTASYHLSLDPSGTKVWSAAIPGALSEVPLNPFSNGIYRPLSGSDTLVTSLAFDQNGNAYYTSSGGGGFGSFGRIDLTTFTTSRVFSGLPAAHGMAYDSFTGDLMLFGSNHVTQIDPATMQIVADRTFPGVGFDQGTVDGRGHLFVADNGGNLLFMDYFGSHNIADPGNFTNLQYLDSCLDDVAPLSGPGSFDHIAPTITGTATPPANANGWNNTPVTVNWTCTDAESGIASCSDPTTLTGEGAGQSVTGTATDNAGNTSSATVGPINIDMTPPTITGMPDRAPNAGGWYNADVMVTFTCADALSGIANCTGDGSVSEGLNQSVTGTATDMADNTASATVGGLNVDKTPPTVTINGATTYTVDQTVNVTCTAADALSGLAADPCTAPLASGPAYSLGLGDHAVSVTATDNAGNTTTQSATYTVQVTYDSLCGLTQQWVNQAGVANSLCMKLRNAAAAAARGDMNAKAGLLDAYRHEVAAQSGKFITPDHAAILISLSQSL